MVYCKKNFYENWWKHIFFFFGLISKIIIDDYTSRYIERQKQNNQKANKHENKICRKKNPKQNQISVHVDMYTYDYKEKYNLCT